MLDERPDPLLRERCRILLLAHDTSPLVSYVGRRPATVIQLTEAPRHPFDLAAEKTAKERRFARAAR